jgi:hypothetical protein
MMHLIITITVLLAAVTSSAEWVYPATQERDSVYHLGWAWLSDDRRAPPVSNGWQRVRLWVNSTNGVEAFEQYEDALKPVMEIPEGVQAPIYYIPQIGTNETGIALLAVDGELAVVDGWGSPRHGLEQLTNSLAAFKATNETAKAELRALISGVKTSRSNLTAIAFTGFTAAQSNKLDQFRNRTDAVAQDVLKLERWIKQNVVKDQAPEAQ